MTLPAFPITNFGHPREHDEQLLRLGLLAEKYLADDPNTCLLKLRQLSELLTLIAAARASETRCRKNPLKSGTMMKYQT